MTKRTNEEFLSASLRAFAPSCEKHFTGRREGTKGSGERERIGLVEFMTLPQIWRKTTQHLMPSRRQETGPGQYNIYPSCDLGPGRIQAGFAALAAQLAGAKQVTVDGFPGVLWADFRDRLEAALHELGVRTRWVNVDTAWKSPEELDALLAPYLGGDDPIFGFRYPGTFARSLCTRRPGSAPAGPGC